MKQVLLSLLFCCSLPTAVDGQDLNSYRWTSRPVLVFTPSATNPMFLEQVRLLEKEAAAFKERKVVFIWLTPAGENESNGSFVQESVSKKYYEQFSSDQTSFELILVGLDGSEKFRASNKLTPPETLFQLIDGMPMRRQELRQKSWSKRKGDGK